MNSEDKLKSQDRNENTKNWAVGQRNMVNYMLTFMRKKSISSQNNVNLLLRKVKDHYITLRL